MARGFVLGATAGRTTLTGEGLQHADGHSLLLAATNPAVVAYDPAFAFEIAHIVEDGLRRMYGEQTPREHLLLHHHLQRAVRAARRAGGPRRRGPAARHVPLPAGAGEAARTSRRSWPPASRCPRALRAQELLAEEWDVAADVWSVTQLGRAAPRRRRRSRRNAAPPGREPRACRTSPGAGRRRRPGGRGVGLDARACPTRSGRGCPAPTSRWAPTASASPTPGRRRGGTSTSTPSRSSSPCSRRLARDGEIDQSVAVEAAQQVPDRRRDGRAGADRQDTGSRLAPSAAPTLEESDSSGGVAFRDGRQSVRPAGSPRSRCWRPFPTRCCAG